MIARSARILGTAAVLVMAAVHVCTAALPAQRAGLHVLDVPYLPQSEELCGGAAIAMVMRFFGETNIYAETFSSLVDRSAGGIRGQALLDALHSRGWQAESFRGDAPLVQSHLDSGRPVVALIQDRPGRFHYVVIVGWSAGRVVVHDPARAPYRILDEKSFTQAWSESGFWSLIAAPAAAAVPSDRGADASPVPAPARGTVDRNTTPCGDMVTEGVRLAGNGELDASRRLLEVAAAECPASPAPWREMAGIHALKSEWPDAANDARHALANDPTDALASRILATALYLGGDPDAALAAWNTLGEPVVDLVNVTGLERTRYLVVAREMALHPQNLLTRSGLDAARRRLAELPAAQTTRVSYRPGENGRAQVDAVVLERPRLPTAPFQLAATAIRTATDREVATSVASPSGGGELWSASWRWWEHRPRIAGSFAAPAPFGGVWRTEGFAERQSYREGESVVEESRRRVGFAISDWTPTGLRWEVEAGLDSWRSRARSVSLAVSGEQRLDGDLLSLHGRLAAWAGGVRTVTMGLGVDWRSALRNEGNVWLGRGGVDLAGVESPLALWPGAGTGQGRDVLLRAHPLLHDGVIADGVFGRQLGHAGLEWRRWTQARRTPVRFAPALFVDAAKAGRALGGVDPRAQFDIGTGLRVALPGAGVMRIDVARGLRDGKTAFSVGWTK